MKRCRMLFLLLLFPLLLSGCGSGEDAPPADGGATFAMLATVTAVGEHLEVTVISGPYDASGPYWVITSEETAYYNKDGKKITRGDLSVGDTVSITYSGQVMMSYPPKIVASRVAIK